MPTGVTQTRSLSSHILHPVMPTGCTTAYNRPGECRTHHCLNFLPLDVTAQHHASTYHRASSLFSSATLLCHSPPWPHLLNSHVCLSPVLITPLWPLFSCASFDHILFGHSSTHLISSSVPLATAIVHTSCYDTLVCSHAHLITLILIYIY